MLSKETTIGPRAILKYDIVVTNWGGAYRPTTGIFTAPYDGLYSMSCTLMSHPSNNVHLAMTKKWSKHISCVLKLQHISSGFPDSAFYLEQRGPDLDAESQ